MTRLYSPGCPWKATVRLPSSSSRTLSVPAVNLPVPAASMAAVQADGLPGGRGGVFIRDVVVFEKRRIGGGRGDFLAGSPRRCRRPGRVSPRPAVSCAAAEKAVPVKESSSAALSSRVNILRGISEPCLSGGVFLPTIQLVSSNRLLSEVAGRKKPPKLISLSKTPPSAVWRRAAYLSGL